MKYTGTLIGIESSYGSIYNVVTYDKKCHLWKATIVAEYKGKMLKIVFNWNGDAYDLRLTEPKTDYYTGTIFCSNEEKGTVYLWQYSRGKDILIKGDFNEEGAGDFTCFIEIKPLVN